MEKRCEDQSDKADLNLSKFQKQTSGISDNTDLNAKSPYLEAAAKVLRDDQLPKHVCLIVVSGSHAYGLAHEGSDLDIRGVYLKSLDDFLLETVPKTITLQQGDCAFHPLGKFLHLASQGNPSVLEWLFTEEPELLFANKAGRMLLDNRHLFLSNKVIQSYSGFAKGSWKDLQKKLNKIQNQEDVRKTEKHARHLLRLLWQLQEILEYQTLHLHVSEMPPVLLYSADENRWVLTDQFEQELNAAAKRIEELKKMTSIPDQVDQNAIKQLLKEIHLVHLKEQMKEQQKPQIMQTIKMEKG